MKEPYVIEVSLDTYVNYPLLARELRNKYYREKDISDRLNMDCKIIINHYGVLFEGHELDNSELVVSRVKEHFVTLKKHYDQMRHKRQDKPVIRVYSAKPNSKIHESAVKAFHEANKDVAQFIAEKLEYGVVEFIFRSNGINYTFNPFLVEGLQKLIKQLK